MRVQFECLFKDPTRDVAYVKVETETTFQVSFWKHEESDLSRYSAYQPAITCSKLIIETLEEGVKYVLDVKYVLVHTYGYAYYLIKKRIGQ